MYGGHEPGSAVRREHRDGRGVGHAARLVLSELAAVVPTVATSSLGGHRFEVVAENVDGARRVLCGFVRRAKGRRSRFHATDGASGR